MLANTLLPVAVLIPPTSTVLGYSVTNLFKFRAAKLLGVDTSVNIATGVFRVGIHLGTFCISVQTSTKWHTIYHEVLSDMASTAIL
jgi:hypothetical protein